MQIDILKILIDYEKQDEINKNIPDNISIITDRGTFINYGTRRQYIDVLYLKEKYFSNYTIPYIRENIRLMEECGYIKTQKALPIKLEPNLEIINITNTGYDFMENEGKKSITEIKVQNLDAIPEQLKILNKYIEEITFLKTDEIVLMKNKLEELKKSDTSLPWDTLINGINLIMTMASLKK